MGAYLNPGNSSFQAIRKDYYVDKSGLISFVNGVLGTKSKLICVSRPRRFGKSYAAQMLCAYYDKSCDSLNLFQDLKIAENKYFYEHLNKYDVIYLDITAFISNASKIENTVAELQEKVIAELIRVYPNALTTKTLPDTLSNIHETYKNKFIIIIDEWDALYREAKEDEKLQKDYMNLLRGLFKDSGRTDKIIEGAYMTGILPIKKYGRQSAISDFNEYSMTQAGQLAEYVGFIETEVKMLCDEFHMEFEKIKHWYDGYSFSRLQSIYNPNSVMKAMKLQEYGNFWTQTETYESLKLYIDMNEDGLKEAVVQMLGGASVSVDIGTFQNDMTNIRSRDDVITLLIHLGYLSYDSKTDMASIPNEEIWREFVRTAKTSRHKEVAKLILQSDQLLEDTLAMNSSKVAAALEEVHRIGTAPLYYNNEQALRSVIRFAYYSAVDEYQEIQELPSGKGYADVVYIPKKNSDKPALLIELKWNHTADAAIRQMKENHYPEVIEKLSGDILLVGISYSETTQKHTCIIEKLKNN